MTETNNSDGDVKGSQITTIQVSFEDLKDVIRARHEMQIREEVVLRLSPSWGEFDEVETAKLARNDPAAIYPNGKPHIDLHPGLFYGEEHPTKAPEIAQYPDRLTQRYYCRGDHGLDEEADMDDLCDEWWDEALSVWENELKSVLRDEVDLYGDMYGSNAPSVIVEVEWTDLD